MTDTIEFRPWPSIARLNRDIVITEKIDGTNAAVIVTEDGRVAAQSRNRLITPEDDNYGFARWVAENAGALADTLGVGYHYGEWWGAGIQRKYGLSGEDGKRFSLFNPYRYKDTDTTAVDNLFTVPVLYDGPFAEWAINSAIDDLRREGSEAAPGFMNPEGIVIYHTAARTAFKVTLENDEKPKTLVKA